MPEMNSGQDLPIGINLRDIKKGMKVRETIADEVVTVVSIGAVERYGPRRSVRVRFADRTMEYYAPEDLSALQEEGALRQATERRR